MKAPKYVYWHNGCDHFTHDGVCKHKELKTYGSCIYCEAIKYFRKLKERV
jgi:hypothetical protein